jgi:membrane protein
VRRVEQTSRGLVASARALQERVKARFDDSLVGEVWARMLETEFVDRSVALAGKAFVSFFPLIIVVAAFLPAGMRSSVFTTLTHRLGMTGSALHSAKTAFASAGEVRRATGVLGLILTFFYVSSFTTALQRVYLRAWRRPAGGAIGPYVRGAVWFGAVVAYMALLGAARNVLVGGVWTPVYVVVALAGGTALWWLTAWAMLLRQVRMRVLWPSGAITGIAMSAYALSSTVWMPSTVEKNTHQYGIFGVALALVTWFSGAAICILLGACSGPVLARDPGPIGRFLRGGHDDILLPGAPPDLPPPTRAVRLKDAFRPIEDESGPADAESLTADDRT